jgi:hypothetical protein
MSDSQQIIYKKHTFLSSLNMGLSAFAITLVISCTVVVIYGMHFVGDQSDKLISTAGGIIGALPELRASLPPILSDILDDHRQPDYREQIEIKARISTSANHGHRIRTAIEVVNNGSEVVSLLSMRIIILDANDEVVAERNEWAATPFAADHEWRGLLMPRARRRFVSHMHRMDASDINGLRTEVEVTDIRIWNGESETVADRQL